ncbi:hypothetical protein Goshw_001784, partial [Gossypium schwendimanii]|nr:hypothetical protein [Gossypium schwendimanii]
ADVLTKPLSLSSFTRFRSFLQFRVVTKVYKYYILRIQKGTRRGLLVRLSGEKVNREAMYRVLKSLWYIKEEVNFVALNDATILVKFGNIEDRTRMLNLTPWLFDQNLFPLFPFAKGQEMDDYEFNIMPFWIRIYNIPFEQMDREVAIDVGKAIGEVVAIDWHDRNGRWTEYIRIRVKIDVLRPLRRVVHLVGNEGTETHLETNNLNFQYGSWLRPKLRGPTQARGNRRNGIEILEKKINPREETNGNKDGNREENNLTMPKGKDNDRVVEK